MICPTKVYQITDLTQTLFRLKKQILVDRLLQYVKNDIKIIFIDEMGIDCFTKNNGL